MTIHDKRENFEEKKNTKAITIILIQYIFTKSIHIICGFYKIILFFRHVYERDKSIRTVMGGGSGQDSWAIYSLVENQTIIKNPSVIGQLHPQTHKTHKKLSTGDSPNE